MSTPLTNAQLVEFLRAKAKNWDEIAKLFEEPEYEDSSKLRQAADALEKVEAEVKAKDLSLGLAHLDAVKYAVKNSLRVSELEAKVAALEKDRARLRWLIHYSALDDREGKPIQLIVTEKAVANCPSTDHPEYVKNVTDAIDAASIGEQTKGEGV